ncbi:MAG TPA: hypothetical protein VNI01_10105 [Elusimicrobiota bacterium]|jgi:hypothetical protein|nr:hypothetical protein [Elusimicrobiota bacterium]
MDVIDLSSSPPELPPLPGAAELASCANIGELYATGIAGLRVQLNLRVTQLVLRHQQELQELSERFRVVIS